MKIKIDTSKDELLKAGEKVVSIEISKDYLVKNDKEISNSKEKTFLITYVLEDGSRWILENEVIFDRCTLLD